MEWGFGQVVPLVLLASPLLTIMEYFYPGTHLRPYLRALQCKIENLILTDEPTPQNKSHPHASEALPPRQRQETLDVAESSQLTPPDRV